MDLALNDPIRQPRGQIRDIPMGSPKDSPAIVDIEDLHVHFHLRGGITGGRSAQRVRAIDGVDLVVDEGTTYGLVGESGSGKSTLARVILRLVSPTSGSVIVDGVDLQRGSPAALRAYRQKVQVVFQDPFSSLDPRMKVRQIIAEPLIATGYRQRLDVRRRVSELLELVGLPPQSADAYPHQFSGGQQQRIAIARALAPHPRLVVLDEPTSALDVSIRAQILALLRDLQSDLNLTYIIISHDLLTIAQMATKVGVMYLGRIVEEGPVRDIFRAPAHPYTQALLTSVPQSQHPGGPRLAEGYEIASAIELPQGCRFKSGCVLRRELGFPAECERDEPMLGCAGPNRTSACHFREAAVEVGRSLRLVERDP